MTRTGRNWPRRCAGCGEQKLGYDYPHDVKICRECDLKHHRRNLEGLTAEEFVAKSGWVLARTMMDIPHQYTVRDLENPDARRTTAMGHAEFEWFARLTFDRGTHERWGYYYLSYLHLDGWKYWTMGLAPEVTTIINRAPTTPETEALLDRQVRAARQPDNS